MSEPTTFYVRSDTWTDVPGTEIKVRHSTGHNVALTITDGRIDFGESESFEIAMDGRRALKPSDLPAHMLPESH